MHKLLIADGSPMMHRIMELTFAQESIQVIAAADGEQALSLLPIARPDVVIADHALPGRSGYEIAAFVKGHAELAHVPVLLLASPFEPLDQARAEAAGVAGEITKPFDPAQLVARVRALLLPPATPLPPPPEAFEPTHSRGPALKLVESAPAPRGALDDYFDRLDAALARLDDQIESASEPSGRLSGDAVRAPAEDGRLPTLDRILGDEAIPSRGAVLIDHPLRGAYGTSGLTWSEELPATQESGPPVDAGVQPLDTRLAAETTDLGALVDALESLRDRRGAAPPTAVSIAEPYVDGSIEIQDRATDAAPVSDAVVEEVTRRVLERLVPGAIDRVVTDVVTRVAERLLREEIARLRR